MVGDVAGGLCLGHAGHGVAQGCPLLQGGEDGELHGAAQGGLADEEAGQRGVLVHRGVPEHAGHLQLLVGQEVGLVDFTDRCTVSTALTCDYS